MGWRHFQGDVLKAFKKELLALGERFFQVASLKIWSVSVFKAALSELVFSQLGTFCLS